MWKWKLLAILGLAVGVAGVAWGYAQTKAVGFFELRVYTALPGKRVLGSDRSGRVSILDGVGAVVKGWRLFFAPSDPSSRLSVNCRA